jgi:hypothetical protein
LSLYVKFVNDRLGIVYLPKILFDITLIRAWEGAYKSKADKLRCYRSQKAYHINIV